MLHRSSGTIYPAMRRRERDSLIRSRSEKSRLPTRNKRPPATLDAAGKRYLFLAKLIPLLRSDAVGIIPECRSASSETAFSFAEILGAEGQIEKSLIGAAE
jgi:hypothetical protein